MFALSVMSLRWRENLTRALGCVAFLLMLLAEFAAHGEKAGSPNPPAPQALEKAIQRGREFLIKNQNKDGSWGTAQKTKGLNIFAPVPGAHHAFRSAVTAMCIAALIETGAADQDTQAKQALERGEAWLLKNLPHLRRADAVAIYNVWGHAYGIHALANMYRRASPEPARQQQIKEEILAQIDLLRRYESVDGGWGYYDFRAGTKRPASDSTSFVTATVLVAFHAVKKNGIEIPEDPVRRGVASINRQRKNDNTYAYDQALRMRPMMGINRPGGSLGRSQACNLALRLWGDKTITDQVITHWLDRLVARNDWLSFGRKRPVPHESWFMVAGYFFYYGHYYAALGLEQLNVAQARPYQDRLAGILLPLQEKDGSWWDYPLYNYHQQYGTAFALMSLARCRQQAP